MKMLLALISSVALFMFSYVSSGHADMVPGGQAAPSLSNPYTNMTDGEFALLQSFASKLEGSAAEGLEAAQSSSHTGRYGEDNYLDLLQSFADSAGSLSSTLQESPVDIRKVHMAIKALKTLVLDIDDVFVYNAGYLNQIRGWNESKRVLRRIDGLVYREGGLRRFERIWDANDILRDAGSRLNMHGALSNLDDRLHRSDKTASFDKLVGREGGGRKAAHVWTLPDASYSGELANDRSTFNEGLKQY
jgi:hypothetical protein